MFFSKKVTLQPIFDNNTVLNTKFLQSICKILPKSERESPYGSVSPSLCLWL